jgi:uncharacterized protein (TIGR03435 family)
MEIPIRPDCVPQPRVLLRPPAGGCSSDWGWLVRLAVRAIAAVALFVGALSGQPRPSFEVASIKLNSNCESGGLNNLKPGGLDLPCTSLRRMISIAFGQAIVGGTFNPRGLMEVTGGPAWLDTDRYDVLAKAEGNPPLAEILGPLFQALLQDRFKVQVHKESRDAAVYLLSVAKGGPKLQPFAEGSCVPLDLNNLPKTPPAPGEPLPKLCGGGGAVGSGSKIILDWTGVTIAELTGRALSRFVDHPIVDQTGLARRYTVHLDFVRESAPNPTAAPGSVAADPSPTIFSALEEQLGLRLMPGKAPMDVIVVDHAEKPSAN